MNKNARFCCKNYNIFNLLAPDYCHFCGKIGHSVCRPCQGRLKKCCKNYNTWANSFVISSKDSSPELFELIKHFKYHSVSSLISPLSELIASALPDASNVVIVPAPTAPKHIRIRGLGHTEKIAYRIAKTKGWEYQKLLIRKTNSHQVGTDSKTREAQARSAYAINPRVPIDNSKTYLIFDDITTTGATLNACKEKLSSAGVRKISTAILLGP
jgi:ComF family protein